MSHAMDPDPGGNYSLFEKINKTHFDQETAFDNVLEHLVRMLYLYYSPFLVFFGAIGNLASLYVFFSSKLRTQATSHYLSALALSDTFFLILLLPPWMEAFQMTGIFHHRGFCQMSVYISYVTCCLSAWLVVAVTLERFIAVLYPLKRNIVCSVKRTKYIIVGITLAAFLLNIPVLRYAMPNNDDCVIDTQYMAHAARFNLVDTVLSFTIPLLLIVFLNSWIMAGIFQLYQIRRELMKAGQTTIRPGMRRIPSFGCTRSQQKVTTMLLIVSTVFVVLNLPAYTMRVVAYATNLDIEKSSLRWRALQQLVLLLFDTNFGINFLLYCLSGQNFREALNTTFRCRRRQAFQAGAAMQQATAFRLAHYNSDTSLRASVYAIEASASHRTRPLRGEDQYMGRWTFDNSRQRAARQASLDAQNFQFFDMDDLPTYSECVEQAETYTTMV